MRCNPKFFLMILASAWSLGGLAIDVSTKENTQMNTKISGELRVPAALAGFDGRRVEIRLFARDPRILDRPAELEGTLDIEHFKHAAGTDTMRPFTLILSKPYRADFRYYATFFVLKGQERTHMGQCAHAKGGTCSVLAPETPSTLTVNFAEVPL